MSSILSESYTLITNNLDISHVINTFFVSVNRKVYNKL